MNVTSDPNEPKAPATEDETAPPAPESPATPATETPAPDDAAPKVYPPGTWGDGSKWGDGETW